MAEATLTLRELNRATLARQMLLQRAETTVADAVERLAGLQAQVANPPYIGLWSRLAGFRREDLTRAMERRRVVRAPLLRSTLHLMTDEDYLLLRSAVQPALNRGYSSFFGRRTKGLDEARILAEAQAYLKGGPRTLAEVRDRLAELEPDRDPAALSYAVRTFLPLVQVYPAGTWSTGGSPAYALAEQWLGRPVAASHEPRELVLRYLAAFGPSTVKDAQAWAGMTRLKGAFEELRTELRTFRDEAGKELFDLPDAPRPPGEAPAPARFLPDYDNLVLSHADRRRVVADEHRGSVFLSAGRVRATFLLDGFAGGTWKVEKDRGAATLVITPFEPLSAADREALAPEGERLLLFIEDGAASRDLRFVG